MINNIDLAEKEAPQPLLLFYNEWFLSMPIQNVDVDLFVTCNMPHRLYICVLLSVNTFMKNLKYVKL